MVRRRNRGRGGRVPAMSKECRIVNGGGSGGFVNHCEQVLDDQNKTVIDASEIDMDSDSEQTVASINRVYPPSSNKVKAPSSLNHKLKEESGKSVVLQNEKILQLTNEVDYLKHKLAVANEYISELVAREKNLDVLPPTRVSSTCSSGVGDLSSAKIQYQQEQQDIKPKKGKICQAATEQPNPDPLESNQTKRRRTSIMQARSAKIGTMQELSLITADDAYYTCLENYDPINDEPVSKLTKSHLKVPSYRVKKYSGRHSVEGTEKMSNDIFEKRHYKYELDEQKRKKRDLQRTRELIRVEHLKKGRNKHHSQKSNNNNKEELTTLLPSPLNIKAIEITNKLPVSAFGVNLYDYKC